MVAIYKGEMFLYDPRPKEGKHRLYTEIREKAQRYGFLRGNYYYYKLVEPDEYEVYIPKKEYSPGSYYFVKYGEDFFRVEDDFFDYASRLAERTNGRYPYPEERGDRVFIYTIYRALKDKYDLVDVEEDYHDIEMGKWVKESEITPVDRTDERLAYYKRVVFQILDQRGNEYLIASGLNDEMMPWYTDDRFYKKPEEPGWEKVGNKWQKWMPAEKLYIYGEEEIPPRI